MKQLAVLTLLIFSPFANQAQISTGKVGDTKKKTETEPGKEAKDPSTRYDPEKNMLDFTVFLGAGYSIGSHRLAENGDLFGREIGIRAEEKMVNRWTYQAGVRNRINRFLSFEAGLSIDRYGESYSFESATSDSVYSYERSYNMLALPIQLYFTYGKRVQFLAGVGIQPYIPLGMRTEFTIMDSLGTDISPASDAKTIEGLNSAGISLLFSAGVQYRFSKYVSAYVIPAYSYGLTNIYSRQEPHKEWLNALNIRFGLALHFPEATKTRTKKVKDPNRKKVFEW